jgi:hypothetical protein
MGSVTPRTALRYRVIGFYHRVRLLALPGHRHPTSTGFAVAFPPLSDLKDSWRWQLASQAQQSDAKIATVIE